MPALALWLFARGAGAASTSLPWGQPWAGSVPSLSAPWDSAMRAAEGTELVPPAMAFCLAEVVRLGESPSDLTEADKL